MFLIFIMSTLFAWSQPVVKIRDPDVLQNQLSIDFLQLDMLTLVQLSHATELICFQRTDVEKRRTIYNTTYNITVVRSAMYVVRSRLDFFCPLNNSSYNHSVSFVTTSGPVLQAVDNSVLRHQQLYYITKTICHTSHVTLTSKLHPGDVISVSLRPSDKAELIQEKTSNFTVLEIY